MTDALPGLPFRVTGELGRGGMGVVYRASDPKLGRDLAIKVPLSTLSGTRRERFLREGQASAALEHPGILKVHAAGLLDDGRPWLAYELVNEPRALDAAWSEQDRPARVASIRDAARAVGHAHAHGIVHRDIKADNVLVDREGRVRVADFGLALTAGLDRLTQTEALLGTPTMMAPEQISAQKDVGPAVDVWALGILLYQALTDEHPFDQNGTWQDLIASISRATPTPPRRLRPDIPRPLEKVVLRCLSSDPKQRYPDGESLASAIEAALAEDGTNGARRLALAGLGLVALVVAIGVTATRAPDPAHPEPTPSTAASTASTPHRAPAHSTLTPEEQLVADAERLLPKDPQAAGALLRKASAAGYEPATQRLTALLGAGRVPPAPGEDVVKLLQQGAASGNVIASYHLALRLQDGRGLPHDPERAVVLLERAAQAGHTAAAGAFAYALRIGRGVMRDDRRAIQWAREAAKANDPNGLAILAGAHMFGRAGTEVSRLQAKRYADRLANTGHPEQFTVLGHYYADHDPKRSLQAFRDGAARDYGPCVYMVGYAHEAGVGVAKNEREALSWYRRAAAINDRQGLQALARYLLRGRGGATLDLPKAIGILKSLMRRGFPKAMFDLARCHEQGLGVEQDPARASELHRLAADRGLPQAAFRIAQRLGDGLGVKADHSLAARYYRQAISRDYARAYAGLGQLHKLGLGVKQDLGRAYELFKLGAAKGDREGSYRLGLMHMRGEPIPKDEAQARKLFRAAAGAHHRKAALRLAVLLEEGRGGAKDPAEALVWYRRSADWGTTEAQVRLAKHLLSGEHVPRDAKAAEALLKQAAAAGDAEAKALLKQPKR